jgi:hypothetical protein
MWKGVFKLPRGFSQCVRRKGRVRTVTGPDKEHGLGKDEYVHFCVIEGESYRGEVHKKKDKGDNK